MATLYQIDLDRVINLDHVVTACWEPPSTDESGPDQDLVVRLAAQAPGGEPETIRITRRPVAFRLWSWMLRRVPHPIYPEGVGSTLADF